MTRATLHLLPTDDGLWIVHLLVDGVALAYRGPFATRERALQAQADMEYVCIGFKWTVTVAPESSTSPAAPSGATPLSSAAGRYLLAPWRLVRDCWRAWVATAG